VHKDFYTMQNEHGSETYPGRFSVCHAWSSSTLEKITWNALEQMIILTNALHIAGKSMREFILYSRKGRTNAMFANLRDAGRLDVVHECITASLFFSHGLRRNVVFHAMLSGPPNPPVHVKIDGATLYDVRTDQETWKNILQKVLYGKSHPGITVDRKSFEALLKEKASKSQVYVLEERGKDIETLDVGVNPVFVLGDHIGLPKTVEDFTLRYGEKVSLGKQPYLAASCITILNYLMDKKAIV
jgi:tRNA (pseudouridine54-N1)-methyltransferase